MCRAKFRGLALVVDLLLQTFHFIECIRGNNFPLYCIIFPIVKGVDALILTNVVLGYNPASHFLQTSFDSLIFPADLSPN